MESLGKLRQYSVQVLYLCGVISSRTIVFSSLTVHRAWCYTNDPNVRWDYCDIPSCGTIATPPPTPELTGEPTSSPTSDSPTSAEPSPSPSASPSTDEPTTDAPTSAEPTLAPSESPSNKVSLDQVLVLCGVVSSRHCCSVIHIHAFPSLTLLSSFHLTADT